MYFVSVVANGKFKEIMSRIEEMVQWEGTCLVNMRVCI